MNLESLKSIFSSVGADHFLFKPLSENDNSKNQVYLGGSYELLQMIPYGDIRVFADAKRPNFKAAVNFFWIGENGKYEQASHAQLILYPKYPEVRLSGFLKGCSLAPSEHMKPPKAKDRTGAKDGRILILAPVGDRIYAYLAPADSQISNQLLQENVEGVFERIDFIEEDVKADLIRHLIDVYKDNPHELVRLHPDGSIRPYSSKNAAGYTLEASFGIIPNGIAEPDYKGWELKCFNSSAVTLMTPEPDGGEYHRMGVREFVTEYGHQTDDNKMYFTGPYSVHEKYKYGVTRNLIVLGYDFENRKITDVNGAIVLLQDDLELASWSFAHILTHWSRKHDKACYMKYVRLPEPNRNKIDFKPSALLCETTLPEYFLDSVVDGTVYFDPGSRISEDGTVKPRNQFRVKEKDIFKLYGKHEIIKLDIE